ncbi:MAG: 1-acyl-sn-glycerol-3-phosphate acyltransferase [bacterium]|nr:1-acyl-sn-glycerol-3-phosphate acyltransferase [bacterium]
MLILYKEKIFIGFSVALHKMRERSFDGRQKITDNEFRMLKVLTTAVSSPFYDIQIYGREKIPEEGPAIIASKHAYGFDPVLMGLLLEKPFAIAAKNELFEGEWWAKILGPIYSRMGAVKIGGINKENNSQKYIEQCLSEESGKRVVVFVEGHRVEGYRPGRIKSGLAALIEGIENGAEIPIVPVGHFYSKKPFPSKESLNPLNKTKIAVVAGEPVYRENFSKDNHNKREWMKNVREFSEELRGSIDECCIAAKHLVESPAERTYLPKG